MESNDNERYERTVELEFDDRLKRMPEQRVRVIRHRFLYFKYPKFWWDDRKILFVTRIFRTVACAALVASLAITATSLVVNDKKRDWDLHTYDQDGVVKWVESIKKIK